MDELKPCPFCGRSGRIIKVYQPSQLLSDYKVECSNAFCGVCPETRWFVDEEMAIEAWNRRGAEGA